MEDTSDDLKQEIKDILRNEKQRELQMMQLAVASATSEGGYGDTNSTTTTVDTAYFESDGLTDSFTETRVIRRRRRGLKRASTTDGESSVGVGVTAARPSAVRSDSATDYDSYNRRLDELQLRKTELTQGVRDVRRRMAVSKKEAEETSAGVNTEAEMQGRLEKMVALLESVSAEETKTRSMVERLRPAYLKLMDGEPEQVHFEGSAARKATASPRRKVVVTSTPQELRQMTSVGAVTEALKRRKQDAMKEKRVEEAAVARAVAGEGGGGVTLGEEEQLIGHSADEPVDLATGFMAELRKRFQRKL